MRLVRLLLLAAGALFLDDKLLERLRITDKDAARGIDALVAENFPDTKYWNKTPDPEGYMQAGYAGSIKSRTLINFPIPTSYFLTNLKTASFKEASASPAASASANDATPIGAAATSSSTARSSLAMAA